MCPGRKLLRKLAEGSVDGSMAHEGHGEDESVASGIEMHQVPSPH